MDCPLFRNQGIEAPRGCVAYLISRMLRGSLSVQTQRHRAFPPPGPSLPISGAQRCFERTVGAPPSLWGEYTSGAQLSLRESSGAAHRCWGRGARRDGKIPSCPLTAGQPTPDMSSHLDWQISVMGLFKKKTKEKCDERHPDYLLPSGP